MGSTRAVANDGFRVLLILSCIAYYVSGSCSFSAGGTSYDLSGFGSIKGSEGATLYYINFCQNLPQNTDAGALCTTTNPAGNALQLPPGLGCTLLGQNPVVTERADGLGITVSMQNKVCCDCPPGSGVYRGIIMDIYCPTSSNKANLDYVIEEPVGQKCQYIGNITHSSGCKGGGSGSGSGSGSSSGKNDNGDVDGLSPGSIFLIIFFVSAVVYIIAGFIVNWKVRGASPGVDAIPNVEFWKQVPGLFVDGLVFTKNKVAGLFGRGYNQL